MFFVHHYHNGTSGVSTYCTLYILIMRGGGNVSQKVMNKIITHIFDSLLSILRALEDLK